MKPANLRKSSNTVLIQSVFTGLNATVGSPPFIGVIFCFGGTLLAMHRAPGLPIALAPSLDLMLATTSANVALRYDATPNIGLGHAVRIETLTSALQNIGTKVHHVVPAETKTLLEQRGVPDSMMVCLDSDEWGSLLHHVSHIVLDTLWTGNARQTAREVHQLKSACDAHLTVIDSMPPDHFVSNDTWKDPDLLVTPYHQADLLRPAPSHAQWLQGARFALLSEEYCRLRSSPHQSTEQHRLLVCTGGSDPDELSLRIALWLTQSDNNNHWQVDIVIGPMFSLTLTQTLFALENTNSQICLHWHPSSIAHLMHGATLITGRPGLLRYEAACLGTPALLLSATPHYREYYERFNDAGLAEIYFQTDPDGELLFMERLNVLQTSPPPVNEAGKKNIDGMGAQRIAQTMLGVHSVEISEPHYAS